MRINLKSLWWLLVLLVLVCGLIIFNQWRQHSVRAKALTVVLNEHWNPYGNPPEYIAKYPYKITAQRLEKYITQSSPSVDQLVGEIMKAEQEYKLRRNPERAKRVAELLLEAYHNPSK